MSCLVGETKGEKLGGAEYTLHPLIHTLLKFNVAQDIWFYQHGGVAKNPQLKHLRVQAECFVHKASG